MDFNKKKVTLANIVTWIVCVFNVGAFIALPFLFNFVHVEDTGDGEGIAIAALLLVFIIINFIPIIISAIFLIVKIIFQANRNKAPRTMIITLMIYSILTLLCGLFYAFGLFFNPVIMVLFITTLLISIINLIAIVLLIVSLINIRKIA